MKVKLHHTFKDAVYILVRMGSIRTLKRHKVSVDWQRFIRSVEAGREK